MDEWIEMTRQEKEMAVYLAVILNFKSKGIPIMVADSPYGPLERDAKLHHFAQGVAAHLCGIRFFRASLRNVGHSISSGPGSRK